jgi:AraC-like DNA-binding protein
MISQKQDPMLFFWTGHFMYIGHATDTTVHEHHAIQIAISFDEGIEIILPYSTGKYKAIIIDSDQPHECRTYDTLFLLLNIDPHTNIGAGLKKTWLSEQKMAVLPEADVSELLETIRPLLSGGQNTDTIYAATVRFLLALSHTREAPLPDDRITKVLDILRYPGENPLKVKDLAATVYLSPGRLIHLFTEQVGIPIRKYILWTKLLTALQKIIETRNMTDAALESGFSDAPHFNRTFKKMFGLNPSALLKNSQIVQARTR